MAVFQSHSPIIAQLAGFHGESSQGCLGVHCHNVSHMIPLRPSSDDVVYI